MTQRDETAVRRRHRREADAAALALVALGVACLAVVLLVGVVVVDELAGLALPWALDAGGVLALAAAALGGASAWRHVRAGR